MIRRSACGMNRKVFGAASAWAVAGRREKASATMAAARKMRGKEVIGSPVRPFAVADLTRSGFTLQKPRHKLFIPGEGERRSIGRRPGYRIHLGSLTARPLPQESPVTG